MNCAYTEDQLVEQPAVGIFTELGWPMVAALEESFGLPTAPPRCDSGGEGKTGATWIGSEGEGPLSILCGRADAMVLAGGGRKPCRPPLRKRRRKGERNR